jgi:photosystem II stability/assembly factor-like uncharacterized protein
MKTKSLLVSFVCIYLSFLGLGCPTPNIVAPPTIGGSGNLLIITTDGGATWTEKTPPQSNGLNALEIFTSDLRNYTIMGGAGLSHLITTTNGGTNWLDISTTDSLYGIKSVTENIAFVVGRSYPSDEGAIFKTSNGGLNWTNLYEFGIFRPMWAIDFGTEMNGMILPYRPIDSIVVTTDGGTSWMQRQPLNATSYINAISFISGFPGTEVVVCGDNSRIFRTTDLGESWDDNTFNLYSATLNSIDFIDPVGIIVGNDGALLRSQDRGMVWFDVSGVTTKNLKKVYLDVSAYWAVGDNIIIKSTDQGQTWNIVRSSDSEFYSDIVFSKGNGIVIGSRN